MTPLTWQPTLWKYGPERTGWIMAGQDRVSNHDRELWRRLCSRANPGVEGLVRVMGRK